MLLLLALLLGAQAQARTATLDGVVVDEQGRAVVDALVLVRSTDVGKTLAAPISTRTDANGAFRFGADSIDAKGTVILAVFARGFAPETLTDAATGSSRRIVLTPGDTLRGSVFDARTKDPIANARIETGSMRLAILLPPDRPDLGRVVATTDERGRFSLSGLASGSHFVRAAARGYGSATAMVSTASADPIELFLRAGAAVRGRVLGPDDKPLEGASVQVRSTGPHGFLQGDASPQRTDHKGRFEVLGLAPGRHRLVASHPDLSFLIVPDVEVGDEDVSVGALHLARGSAIVGRLVDEAGNPLEGRASLPDLWTTGSAVIRSTRAEVGADGRFRLGVIPPGDYSLSVEPRGFAARRIDVSIGDDAEGRDVSLGDVVFGGGLTIEGLVLDSTGGPVADADVSAYSGQRFRLELGREGALPARGKTGADGSFRLSGLELGAYRVSASAPGFGADDGTRVEAGATDVEIVLERAGTIGGTAVDAAGKALRSFFVMAEAVPRGRRANRRQTQDDGAADGSFTIAGLEAGRYRLTVSSEGFKPTRLDDVLVVGGETTDVGRIVVRAGGVLHGVVLDPDGRPVGGATVNTNGRRWEWMYPAVTTDRAGTFEIRGLEDGRLDVTASHPEFASGIVEDVEIREESGPSDVTVRLTPGGVIEGIVRARDGTGIPGRTIQMRGGNVRDWDTVTTGPNGRFRLDKLASGTYRLALLSTGSRFVASVQEKEVQVRDQETRFVELPSREIEITGLVTKSGAALAGAHVAYRRADARGFVTMTDDTGDPTGPLALNALTTPDGFYELYVDGPGEYSVTVMASDGATRFPSTAVLVPDVEAHRQDLNFGTVTLHGIVVDESNEPVRGARVAVSPLESSPTLSTAGWARTENSGAFRIELEPDRYRLTAAADGFSPVEKALDLSQAEPPELVLVLEKGRTIRGRAVAPDGTAAGRCYVHAVEDTRPTNEPPRITASGESNADGTFAIGSLAPVRYNVLVVADRYGIAFAPGVMPGDDEITLPLRPPARVALRVVGRDGAPVTRARVALTAADGRKVRGVFGMTDAHGIAELVVPAGAIELKVVMGDVLQGLTHLTVSEGQSTSAEVVLQE